MAELLDTLRPLAFAIAYRMLGSVAEAEDVVQEALVRLHGVLDAGEQIEVAEAYLATVVTLSVSTVFARRRCTEEQWPPHLPVRQVRIARPTDRLEEVTRFYRDGLGPTELFRFHQHDGYDGVMLGLPGSEYHLEFTHHVDGSPCPAPTRDNLLVLYFASDEDVLPVSERLQRHGGALVEADNPFWTTSGAITIEDPDGWRVVLVSKPFLAAT